MEEKQLTSDELAKRNAEAASEENKKLNSETAPEVLPPPAEPPKISMRDQLRSLVASGGVLTSANLLIVVRELRELTIMNGGRIIKFRPIANGLGGIETLLVESLGVPEDPKQEKLELDRGNDIPPDLNTQEKPAKGKGKGRRNRKVEAE